MAKIATFVIAVFVSMTFSVFSDDTKLGREAGAIYVEDFLEKPIKLKVLQPATAYFTLSGERYLGTLRAGQEVTLLALSDSGKAYRVRGKAQQGDVAGWVGTGFFNELKPEFIENLKKAYERHVLVTDLIESNEVALGMTVPEVQESLGKPNKKSSAIDETDGRSDTFEYITYDRVPQTSYGRDIYGNVFRRTTYIKVETGRVSVSFKEGVVTRIEESDEDPDRGAVKIIPSPIIVF